MPAKMMMEMPLPIPRSLTCSPSHMRKMVPVTRVTTVVMRKPRPAAMTTGAPPALWLSRAIATPRAWNVASSTVPYRVYWVIFRRPCSPSFLSCSSFGCTTDRSCMMIAAEMYGMMPIAKIENRLSAPPENMLNMSRIVPRCCSKSASRATGSIPGTGMKEPIRKMRIAPRTNSSRWRSSDILPPPREGRGRADSSARRAISRPPSRRRPRGRPARPRSPRPRSP